MQQETLILVAIINKGDTWWVGVYRSPHARIKKKINKRQGNEFK